MHDNKTVAHEINIGDLELVTIWHVDPETDGTDDSCGYTFPKPSMENKKIIFEAVKWDISNPFYSSPYMPLTQVDPKYNYSQTLAGDTVAHIAAAWLHIKWCHKKNKKLSSGEITEIFKLGVTPDDNLRSILSDMEEQSEYRVTRFLNCVMRSYLAYHRPWWKHPKWHIHHWEFQIHPYQKLKRMLFERCAICNSRFKWGYAPISNNKLLYHHDCYKQRLNKKD